MTRLRVATLACCAVALVAACDSSGRPSDPTPAPGSSTQTSATAPTSTTATAPTAVEQATQVGKGLSAFVTEHPLTSTRTKRQLTSCPFGTVRSFSAALDGAGADTRGYDQADANVQKYVVRRPNQGVIGDRGVAASCTARSDGQVVLGVSASTNAEPTPAGKVPGLRGPRPYREGQTYTKTNERTCFVYWVPPKRNYVMTVVFRSKEASPTSARCRAGFAAAAPAMITSLAKLAR